MTQSIFWPWREFAFLRWTITFWVYALHEATTKRIHTSDTKNHMRTMAANNLTTLTCPKLLWKFKNVLDLKPIRNSIIFEVVDLSGRESSVVVACCLAYISSSVSASYFRHKANLRTGINWGLYWKVVFNHSLEIPKKVDMTLRCLWEGLGKRICNVSSFHIPLAKQYRLTVVRRCYVRFVDHVWGGVPIMHGSTFGFSSWGLWASWT